MEVRREGGNPGTERRMGAKRDGRQTGSAIPHCLSGERKRRGREPGARSLPPRAGTGPGARPTRGRGGGGGSVPSPARPGALQPARARFPIFSQWAPGAPPPHPRARLPGHKPRPPPPAAIFGKGRHSPPLPGWGGHLCFGHVVRSLMAVIGEGERSGGCRRGDHLGAMSAVPSPGGHLCAGQGVLPGTGRALTGRAPLKSTDCISSCNVISNS